MIDIAWVRFEPADLIPRAVARNHAKARRSRLGLDLPHIIPKSGVAEHYRQIMENDVVLSQAHVVGKARPWQFHPREIGEFVVLAYNAERHPWFV